jgi:hypothetical protein
MKNRWLKALLVCVLEVVLLIVAGAAYFATMPSSQTCSGPLTATPSEVRGDAKMRSKQGAKLASAENGQRIGEGGEELTGVDGRVRMDLSNGTFVRVVPDTTFRLEKLDDEEVNPFTRLRIEFGELWVILMAGGDPQVCADSSVC